ncbi:hypothetical protein [Microcoleus sp. FACHB-672]|uniref:hypothetical protein n=1 Tax=Microcoleus sp. FACHB-672 TaxID=2692825 RepID=UPI0016892F6F|nr:hypothetical protein [Microcoleus sp. FACHB-672]MBD2041956.1 hypothetical protein [Microcoleus sp. FACHB-672]
MGVTGNNARVDREADKNAIIRATSKDSSTLIGRSDELPTCFCVKRKGYAHHNIPVKESTAALETAELTRYIWPV